MKNQTYFHYLIGVLLVISAGISSCSNCMEGHGPVIVEDRQTELYSKLEVDVVADVTITPGEDLFIRIEAQENLLEHIQTKIKGKTLIIKSQPCFNSDEPVKISLTIPMLTAVSLNGSSSVSITEQMDTESLDIDINGSGSFYGEVFANAIETDINGSGEVLLSGSVKKLDVEVNGSGEFMGFELKAFEVDAVMRGSGDVEVNALNKLKAQVLGSGDVRYMGNPQISTSITGSGQVSKKE